MRNEKKDFRRKTKGKSGITGANKTAMLRLKNKEYWLTLFCVIAYYCQGMSDALNENNTTYALEQINHFDRTVFADNFAVYSGGMSARFFMNFLVGIGMKLTGGRWARVGIPLVWFGVFILAVATVEMIANLTDRHRFVCAMILAVYLRNCVNTGFPGWGSFDITTLGLGTAYAFTMLAISQVVGKKKNWNAAWLMLSVGTLFHVHEGIWGFSILFVLYLAGAIREKSSGLGKQHAVFAVFAIVLGLSVLPGIFGEPSGISSEEFVQIYAYYRTSHHLVPSAWGVPMIAKHLLLIVGAALVRIESLYYLRREKVKGFMVEAGLAVFSWIGALAATYLFTEVFPVASIVTMYIPKYFKYVGILSVIWCIKTILNWLESGEPLLAASIAIAVMAASQTGISGILIVYFVCCAAVNLYKGHQFSDVRLLFPVCALTLEAVYDSQHVFLVVDVMILMALLCTVYWSSSAMFQRICKSTAFVAAVSFVVFVCATKGKLWENSNGRVSRVHPESYVVRAAGQELYDLAKAFKNQTRSDELFLAEPVGGSASWFQFVSERNCYVTKKNTPAAQSQIKEWYSRITETTDLFAKSSSEIGDLMHRDGIMYLLVPQAGYAVLEGDDSFEVFLVSEQDAYRIYLLGDMEE